MKLNAITVAILLKLMTKDYWELNSTANFFRDKEPDILVSKAINEIRSGGLNALDIGCGGGRNSLELAKHNFNVSVIDKYKIMIETTEKLLVTNNFRVRHSQVDDISDLHIQEDAFDIILCIGVLHQNNSADSLSDCLHKIYASLKKGGVFVFNVFTNDYIDSELADMGNHRYQTKENAPMLLIGKDWYNNLFTKTGFTNIYDQFDIKDVNTGKRAILRGLLIK